MLTRTSRLIYRRDVAGKIQQSGIAARNGRRTQHRQSLLSGFFVSTHGLLTFWATMGESFGVAGKPVRRSATFIVALFASSSAQRA